jgi:hypothetical protein
VGINNSKVEELSAKGAYSNSHDGGALAAIRNGAAT